MNASSPSSPASPAGAFGARNGLAYGLMGFPLAFAALPLYVILPNHYAREFGVPLATLGAVLLGAYRGQPSPLACNASADLYHGFVGPFLP